MLFECPQYEKERLQLKGGGGGGGGVQAYNFGNFNYEIRVEGEFGSMLSNLC